MFALVGVAFFIAALVPTYVLSRVLLVFFWRSDSGPSLIAGCHVGAYLFCVLVGAIGFAAGDAAAGAPKIMLAVLSFALPQFAWLVMDLVRFEQRYGSRRRTRAPVRDVRHAPSPLMLPPPNHFSRSGTR
ncbi:hypothetical protein [Hwanghaeella sp.]|uniref:hypothetical protein n=1 Tax=Hwanghaeella sp. TaxID=2605943 RepID=UPI003CCC0A28